MLPVTDKTYLRLGLDSVLQILMRVTPGMSNKLQIIFMSMCVTKSLIPIYCYVLLDVCSNFSWCLMITRKMTFTSQGK